jgi:hypothetical protein
VLLFIADGANDAAEIRFTISFGNCGGFYAASPGKGTRPLPFHGMISAVDENAKTFMIASKQTSRVFKVTDKTVITKGANVAMMKDITENEEASGSYWRRADGSLEVKNVKLGPLTKAKMSTASPRLRRVSLLHRNGRKAERGRRCGSRFATAYCSPAALSAAFKSTTKLAYSRSRETSSGWRSSDDG